MNYNTGDLQMQKLFIHQGNMQNILLNFKSLKPFARIKVNSATKLTYFTKHPNRQKILNRSIPKISKSNAGTQALTKISSLNNYCNIQTDCINSTFFFRQQKQSLHEQFLQDYVQSAASVAERRFGTTVEQKNDSGNQKGKFFD